MSWFSSREPNLSAQKNHAALARGLRKEALKEERAGRHDDAKKLRRSADDEQKFSGWLGRYAHEPTKKLRP